MKKRNPLDCVEMKAEIQRKLLSHYEGLSLAERTRAMRQGILSDPILGHWYQRATQKREAASQVAEDPGKYGE